MKTRSFPSTAFIGGSSSRIPGARMFRRPNSVSIAVVALFAATASAACASSDSDGDSSDQAVSESDLAQQLEDAMVAAANDPNFLPDAHQAADYKTRRDYIPWDRAKRAGLKYFKQPHPDDAAYGGDRQKYYDDIPHDVRTPITDAAVQLGMFLYHDPGEGNNPVDVPAKGEFQFSCSTCHNATAAFKPGIRNGIGEGGMGYGVGGRRRVDRKRANFSGLPEGHLDFLLPEEEAACRTPGLPADQAARCSQLAQPAEELAERKPLTLMDLQRRSAPTVINAAWQPIKLRDGSTGTGPFSKGSPGGRTVTLQGLPTSLPDTIFAPDPLGNVAPINGADVIQRHLDRTTPDFNPFNALGVLGIESESIGAPFIHRHDHLERSPVGSSDYAALVSDARPGLFALAQERARVEAIAKVSGSLLILGQEFSLQRQQLLVDHMGAVASFTRQLLTNEAPFQKWIRSRTSTKEAKNSDPNALTAQELRGGALFFTPPEKKGAGCVRCHSGPALDNPLFQNVGFGDLSDAPHKTRAVGNVGPDATTAPATNIPAERVQARQQFRELTVNGIGGLHAAPCLEFGKGDTAPPSAGGCTPMPMSALNVYADPFPDAAYPKELRSQANGAPLAEQLGDIGREFISGNPHDRYMFKAPTLYNVSDASIMGHGGTFLSVRQVVEYFNAGKPENPFVVRDGSTLAPEFKPLNLSKDQVDDLVAFVENALRDPNLLRYQPALTEEEAAAEKAKGVHKFGPLPQGGDSATTRCIIASDPMSLHEDKRCATASPAQLFCSADQTTQLDLTCK